MKTILTPIIPNLLAVFGVVLCLPLLTMAVMGQDSPVTSLTIFRAIDPVRPGEAALLIGDWTATASVEVARVDDQTNEATPSWQPLQPLQVSSQSIKFTIPATWTMGAYTCRVVDKTNPSLTASEPVTLNAADPWWLLGDGGATAASPGGWLRIFGKDLHFEAPSQIRLVGAGNETTLVATAAKDTGAYTLSVVVPADLPSGNYLVSVHNGFGGPDAWHPAGHVQIALAPQWKQDVFDVSQLGVAPSPYINIWFQHPSNVPANDRTQAVKAALDKANANGGGVVYFPRGRYQINEELVIPPHVTLKGEGEGLVSLYWPPTKSPLPSLISGTDDFAVENLSLYTSGAHKNIITGSNNVRVQHVRIRANYYFRHDFIGMASRTDPVTERPAGAGVEIRGDNFVLTDCDIYHSYYPFILHGTRGGLIARNRFDGGQGAFQAYGGSRLIIEDNECSGSAPWASGNALSLGNRRGSSCASYFVYCGHNHIRQVEGGDREAFTTDGHGTAYIGKVSSVQGDHLTLAEQSWWGIATKDMIPVDVFQREIQRQRPQGDFALDEWHGLTLYIIGGRGAGQYRNLLACEGSQVTIDRPFVVPPDTSSIVSIGKFQGRHLFIGNEFQDSSPSVNLYAPTCDCIVAENQAWRTETMNCGASLGGPNHLPPPPDGQPVPTGQPTEVWRVEPSWFDQFVNNHFWEGNGWAEGSTVLAINGPLKFSEKAKPANDLLSLSLGHVIRGNQLDNNAHIEVAGAVRDVIIEHNVVQNVAQGLIVGTLPDPEAKTVPIQPDGVWVGDNTFKNVTDPVVTPK